MFYTKLANAVVSIVLAVVVVAAAVLVGLGLCGDGPEAGLTWTIAGIVTFFAGALSLCGIGIVIEISLNINKIKEMLEYDVRNVESVYSPENEYTPDLPEPVQEISASKELDKNVNTSEYCGNCGTRYLTGAKFCEKCGMKR